MIHYISGGERSGKSSYAQNIALTLSNNPTYVATSRIWDDDHKKRIDRHVNERDERWSSIEEEKQLSQVIKANKTYVIDCVTLWLTNLFMDHKNNIDLALAEAKNYFYG